MQGDVGDEQHTYIEEMHIENEIPMDDDDDDKLERKYIYEYILCG